MLQKIFIILTFLIVLSSVRGISQPLSAGIPEIEKALGEKDIAKAVTLLSRITANYYSQQKPDSLVNYIFYTGKVSQAKSGVEDALKQVDQLIQKIKSLSPAAATLRQAYIEAGEYYGSVGKNNLAYEANKKAYDHTLQMAGRKPSDLGLLENNLSTYAQRMSDLGLSQHHGCRALQHFLSDPNPSYEGLYIAYNGMGSAMYYASKTDSALYFFEQALAALDKTERTPINAYYRPAIVLNNLSGLYSLEGRTTEAINAMQMTISKIKSFIDTKEPHPKKVVAINFHMEAIDNLAGIYKELGDLKQAKELLEYSYRQKQKHLQPDDPGIFISRILLGQLYYAINETDKAKDFLHNGLTLISQADGDYLFWQADASNTLALLHDKLKDLKQAAYYYERADSLYEASLQGMYDNIYLNFLRNAALFYAETGQGDKAISKATKGYNYVLKNQGAKTLTAFFQLLNLAEVNLLLNKPQQALTYSMNGLDVVNANIKASGNLLDSIKMELKKPRVILLKAKAQYQLLAKKDKTNLSALLTQLNEGLTILERRKAVVTDPVDISLVMADHNELLDFVKKITLDLYNVSGDKAYIGQVMSLHESGMYNRIRSRLDKKAALQFAHVPADVLEKEKAYKTAITASFSGNGSHDEKMNRYFKATENWNNFLQNLKNDYPRYYKMRYGSIFRPLGEIQKAIPPNSTLIRYLYIDKQLQALVVDNQNEQLFSLQTKDLEQKITALSKHGMDVGKTGSILHELYQQLWAPIAKSVNHKRVIIVPDGILFNLNFDILTPSKIQSYKELGTKSLLANYTFSYHYSLVLLDQNKNDQVLQKDFVAFAPGFSDKEKERYRLISTDSNNIDNSYLSLLPQPFMLSLASKINKTLGGTSYLLDQSTERSFKKNAGDHKIIHIGTHAESNNRYPEFSRLIFAKDTATQGDNFLYVNEIYNCDLHSNLTVLTACESGKPGYEDGEGMISLAHAFNYAGSESMLTGLWKIDEQASAILMEFFYENLLEGMPKDEALRQAKLSYLQQADGRMLAPQYWAGLVIMGDTSPIKLDRNQNIKWIWWIAGGLLLLFAIFFFTKRKPAFRKGA